MKPDNEWDPALTTVPLDSKSVNVGKLFDFMYAFADEKDPCNNTVVQAVGFVDLSAVASCQQIAPSHHRAQES